MKLQLAMIILAARTAFISVNAQALAPESEVSAPTQTIEEQAVDLARAVDDTTADEAEAAAVEEFIAQEVTRIKDCEREAAELYASRIRCINSQIRESGVTAQQKREARELARQCFLNQIAACHEGTTPKACKIPFSCP